MDEPARQRARELVNTPEFANAPRVRNKVEAHRPHPGQTTGKDDRSERMELESNYRPSKGYQRTQASIQAAPITLARRSVLGSIVDPPKDVHESAQSLNAPDASPQTYCQSESKRSFSAPGFSWADDPRGA